MATIWLSLFAVALSSRTTHASEVVVLTNDNFDHHTKDGFWLLEFYAPWCGHCKRLNPILDEISGDALDAGMHIGKINTAEQKKVAKLFGVESYPTLKFRVRSSDEWSPYEGGRAGKDLLAFADRMTGPALPLVSSTGEVRQVLERADKAGLDSVFLFGAGPSGGASGWADFAEQTAKSLQPRAYSCLLAPGAVVSWEGAGADGALKATALPRDEPFVAVLEAGERPRYFPGALLPPGSSPEAATLEATSKAVEAWAGSGVDAPLMNNFTGLNFRRLGKLGKLLVIAIVDPANTTTPAYLAGFKSVARAVTQETAAFSKPGAGSAVGEGAGVGGEGFGIAERFLFGTMDGVRFDDFVQQFNIFGGLPRVVVLDMPAELYYEDAEVDEADEMATFLREVFDGKVPAQKERHENVFVRSWHRLSGMGWRFWALVIPLVLSLGAALLTAPGGPYEPGPKMGRRKRD